MALPNSGPISLSDLRGEFGGSAPDSLSEYYRGGGLVPDTPANSSVPTSGAISLSDFYGAQSQVIQLVIGNHTDFTLLPGAATAGISLASNGNATSIGTGTLQDWGIPNVTDLGDDYEIRLTVNSGTSPNGSPVGSFFNMGGGATWTLSRSSVGITSGNYTAAIRPAGGGGIIASDTFSIQVNAEN